MTRTRRASPANILLLFAIICATTRQVDAQTRQADSAARRHGSDSSRTSVNIIDGTKLNAVPAFTLEQALQGTIAGMIVNMNDGAPWSDGQIQIRGVSTLWGDPSPLVFVDGVQTTNSYSATAIESGAFNPNVTIRSTADLSGFTPFEIESVEILKGPVATSRYGARGAPGVLLITTRRGADSPSRWRAMVRTGRAEAMRLPGGRCFASVAAARLASPLDSVGIALAANSNGGVLPCRSHLADYFSGQALSSESALQWHGGWAGTGILGSVARKSAPGSIDRTGATRTNLRLNIDQRLTGRLSARLSLGYSSIAIVRGGGSADAAAVLQRYPTWSDARLPLLYARPDVTTSSPYAFLNYGLDDGDAHRGTSSLRVTYDAVRRSGMRLSVEYLAGLDRNSRQSRTFGEYLTQNSVVDSVFSHSRATELSNLDNHVVRARAETARWPDVPVTLEAGVTLDRQHFAQESSSGRLGVGLITQSATRQSSIFGAYAAASTSLLHQSLELSASIRNERIAPWGAGAPRPSYPSVGVLYRVPHLTKGLTIALRGAWGVSGGLGALGTRPFLLQASLFDARVPQLFERRRDVEAGVDISSSNGRAMFSYTAYRSNAGSLYASSVDATVSGFVRGLAPDAAGITTTGHELTLSPSLVRRVNVAWDTRLTFSRSSSTLTTYTARPENLVFGPFGFLGPRQMLNSGERLGAITTSGPAPIASGTASFDAANENIIRIGPVTLRTQLDWRRGGTVYSGTLRLSDVARTSADYDARSPLAGAPQGLYRLRAGQVGDSAGVYLTPGSFVRLREVALRYAVPSRWTARAFGAASVGFSLQARNLAIWSRSVAGDPEFSGTGTQPFARFLDLLQYPTMRQLFLGFDLGI